MFKIFKKKSVYDIIPNEFIEINEGNYEPILDVDIDGTTALLTLPYDVQFPLNEVEIDNYNFVTLEPYREDVIVQLTYSCEHCHRPIAYDSVIGMEAHLDRCLFNEKNSMCTMCKYLTIYEEAPYPRNNQMRTPDAEWAFGSFRKPYCERYEKWLDEETLINKNPKCFEVGVDEIRIKHTEDYDKWLELSTEHYDSLDNGGENIEQSNT